MIELRTPGELDAMRAAGAVVARVLGEVRAAAAPGVRLTQLDAVARDVLAGEGATSPFLGYAPLPTTPPFPGVVCLPVNDVALHGIPTPRPLEDGDLLSVDAGAVLEGWVGDAATTFAVGPGIDTEQGGHGVGRSMHEDPARAQRGRPGRGVLLRSGMVIAIEPWSLAGGRDDYRVDADAGRSAAPTAAGPPTSPTTAPASSPGPGDRSVVPSGPRRAARGRGAGTHRRGTRHLVAV